MYNKSGSDLQSTAPQRRTGHSGPRLKEHHRLHHSGQPLLPVTHRTSQSRSWSSPGHSPGGPDLFSCLLFLLLLLFLQELFPRRQRLFCLQSLLQQLLRVFLQTYIHQSGASTRQRGLYIRQSGASSDNLQIPLFTYLFIDFYLSRNPP